MTHIDLFDFFHRLFLGALTKFRKATTSFAMYVCLYVYLFVRLSAWNNLAPTGRILIKFDIWALFQNLPKNWNFIKIWQE
jgi:hypothetical protein